MWWWVLLRRRMYRRSRRIVKKLNKFVLDSIVKFNLLINQELNVAACNLGWLVRDSLFALFLSSLVWSLCHSRLDFGRTNCLHCSSEIWRIWDKNTQLLPFYRILSMWNRTCYSHNANKREKVPVVAVCGLNIREIAKKGCISKQT